jgi:phage regulator Rha-like protein
VNEIVPVERIAQKMYLIRDKKVMFDKDLAELYEVETFNLNKAVKKNKERFPEDFMFQINENENKSLRFQFGILKRGQHSKYLPYVFTERGVAMLSSVLSSKRAAMINISIMRAFLKMREYLVSHKQIIEKLKKHDENFVIIFNVLKQLTDTPKKEEPKKKIGFRPGE